MKRLIETLRHKSPAWWIAAVGIATPLLLGILFAIVCGPGDSGLGQLEARMMGAGIGLGLGGLAVGGAFLITMSTR